MFYLEELDLEEFEQEEEKVLNRPNRHARKMITRKKMKNQKWYPVYFSERKNRNIRYYRTKYKKDAKKLTNRKIRHTKDIPIVGCGYKKVVDYFLYL